MFWNSGQEKCKTIVKFIAPFTTQRNYFLKGVLVLPFSVALIRHILIILTDNVRKRGQLVVHTECMYDSIYSPNWSTFPSLFEVNGELPSSSQTYRGRLRLLLHHQEDTFQRHNLKIKRKKKILLRIKKCLYHFTLLIWRESSIKRDFSWNEN